MFNRSDTIKPVYFDDMDEVFDEKGSTFISMRKVQWLKDNEEKNIEKAKIELRKYRVTADGERADKGFSFLTNEGPHELARVLVHNGYGDTKVILKELKVRDDFKEAVDHLFDNDNIESSDGEYFDMRNALLIEDSGDEEDDDE